MIPILYESTETAFITNGIARLRDCVSAVVTEERNGVYELDFEYPVDGAHFSDIIPGRIVAVIHDESGDVQPFDIVSYSKPINGVASFHAVHISYRQSFYTVTGQNINSLADALDLVKNNAVPSNPFTYQTDMSSSAYLAGADGTPKTVRELLGGSEGSILDAYGGEYEFDRFSVILRKNRGQTRDFVIRYGVNMTDYTDESDYFGSFNSCVPFWNGEGGPIIGSKVSSGLPSFNGQELCVPLDLSDKFETAPSVADLESAALDYMTGRQVNLPAQNIKVDFLRLQDFSGYEQFEGLLECNLCDTVQVVFPKYGMTGTYKIVRTEYDVLEGRYIEMELGSLQTSLAEALGISGNNLTVSSSGGGQDVRYGVCSTAAGTVAKTVTVTPALTSLDTGSVIFVKFSNSNTATSPTLNVNGLGAKSIRRYGTSAPSTSAATSWNAGNVICLLYDGTYWQMVDWINTSYNSMTVAEYQAGTSTSNRVITPARLKGAIQYWTDATVTTITPSSGSTMTGQECYYAKAGNVVTVSLAITGLTANSTAAITTLPAGYRPRSKITAPIQAGARSDFCSVEIDTDGAVTIATHATRTSALGLVTFIVE